MFCWNRDGTVIPPGFKATMALTADGVNTLDHFLSGDVRVRPLLRRNAANRVNPSLRQLKRFHRTGSLVNIAQIHKLKTYSQETRLW